MTTGRSLRIGEAALGAGLLALGILIAVEATLMPSPGRGAVGPALFPYLVSGGLVLVALSLLREAVAGRIAHEGGLELDGLAVALVAAALAAQFLLVEVLGWIPSATLLFMAVARAFGSRRMLLNAGIGLALAGATFVAFNYGLDLSLPPGSVAEWLAPAE